MSGKKVVLIFGILTVICSVGMGLWIKHAYDTRPQIPVEQQK